MYFKKRNKKRKLDVDLKLKEIIEEHTPVDEEIEKKEKENNSGQLTAETIIQHEASSELNLTRVKVLKHIEPNFDSMNLARVIPSLAEYYTDRFVVPLDKMPVKKVDDCTDIEEEANKQYVEMKTKIQLIRQFNNHGRLFNISSTK